VSWQNQLRVGTVYRYGWNRMARKDEHCRLLVIARRMNSVLVQFENDGYKAVTSANALKPVGNHQPQRGLFDGTSV
jgi:hypothetical protein